MSNTRRPKWTAAQVDAANAEALLTELAADIAVEESPVTRRMMAEVWDLLDGQGRATELPEVLDRIRADAIREVITGRLVAELRDQDVEPGLIAAIERAAMELGTDYWAALYRHMKEGS